MNSENIIEFYKPIKGFERYAISRTGRIYSLRKRRLINRYLSRGYYQNSLRDDNGEAHWFRNHVLVALTYIPKPESDEELVVNHKDGNRLNNNVNNLEWCTQSENTLHAFRILGVERKPIPVVVHNLDTDQYEYYSSIDATARACKLTKFNIRYRLESNQLVFPENKRYKLDDGTPWREDIEYAPGSQKAVMVRSLKDNKLYVFEKLVDACELLKVKPAAISTWIRREGQPVLPGLFQIKLLEDPSPWREVKDPYLELQENSGVNKIIVAIEPNGEVRIFERAIECANHYNVGATTLNWWVKERKVGKNGVKFMYYNDYIQQNGNSGKI